MRRAIVLLMAPAACAPVAGEPVALDAGDPVVFAEDVQPILAASCAASSCHGDAGRPLFLYATRGTRIDAADAWSGEPLFEEELAHNRRQVVALLLGVDAAGDSLVLRKPLPVDRGGVEHAGGTWFESTSDRDYGVLRDWLDGALDDLNR